MHLTMDFITFLAIVATVGGTGSFGIAMLRVRRNGKSIGDDEKGNPFTLNTVYSIVSAKIKEFKYGYCADRDVRVEKNFGQYQKMYRADVEALEKVFRGEIKQINTTISNGLKGVEHRIGRLEEKIDNGNKA